MKNIKLLKFFTISIFKIASMVPLRRLNISTGFAISLSHSTSSYCNILNIPVRVGHSFIPEILVSRIEKSLIRDTVCSLPFLILQWVSSDFDNITLTMHLLSAIFTKLASILSNKKDMLIEALLFMVLLARDAYLFNIRLTCEVSLIVDGSLVELYVNTDSTRDKVWLFQLRYTLLILKSKLLS